MTLHEVYESEEFVTMVTKMRKHFEDKGEANKQGLSQVQEDLKELLAKMKSQHKKSAVLEEEETHSVDISKDMLNMFVRIEVGRRYFNIICMEMLSRAFGMKQPSSLDACMKRQTKIPLDQLIRNGRNLTVE